MGKPKAQPTNQPANPTVEPTNQPANPEPQTGTRPEDSLQDNKDAVNASAASSEPTPNEGEKAPEIEQKDASAGLNLIGFLQFALEQTNEPDQIDALQELIAILNEHPEMEQQFTVLLMGEMAKQYKAFQVANGMSVDSLEDHVALSFRLTGELAQLTFGTAAYDAKLKEIELAGVQLKAAEVLQTQSEEDEDGRKKRVRQNAQAELDALKEESRKRQLEAEAKQADAQPDRREALKDA